jgi:hypothetical protein
MKGGVIKVQPRRRTRIGSGLKVQIDNIAGSSVVLRRPDESLLTEISP